MKSKRQKKKEESISMSQSLLFGPVKDSQTYPKMKRNHVRRSVGKLQLDADEIDKLNNILRKGRKKQLQIYAEQHVQIPLKLPQEVEAFIANKVNENISVNLTKSL